MTTKIEGARCADCPLLDRPFVPGCGEKAPQLVVIGEAPGYAEARDGEPFVGPSGKLLRQALSFHGIESVYITNVVKCHPKGNKLPAKAIACCAPATLAETDDMGGAHLACGNVASEFLNNDPVKKVRPFWRGRATATWHPAYILRAPQRLHEFMWDVGRVARQGKPLEIKHVVPETLAELTVAFSTIVRAAKTNPVTVCIDVETTALHWWEDRVLSIGVARSTREALVIPEEFVESPLVRDLLINLFDEPNISVVGHNVGFDIKFLCMLGVHNARYDYDTLLAHYVLDENTPRDLKTLATNLLDAPDYEGQLVVKETTTKTGTKLVKKPSKDKYDVVPRPQLYEYNAYDVCYNLALWNLLKEQLHQDGLFERPYMYPLMAAVPYITELELDGMPVSLDRLHDLSYRLGTAILKAQDALEKMCGTDFNPNSWQQVAKIMYVHYGLPKISGRGFKRGSTNVHARDELIERLEPCEARTWLEGLNDLKSLMKLRSSYVDNVIPLVSEGLVFPNYRLDGAESGRMSARDPAIQTIPRPGTGKVGDEVWGQHIRGAFVTPEGWSFVGVDYSQAELRTAAALSGDESLLAAYQEGRDIHDETARVLFGDEFTKENRQIAKNFNFASIYSFNENAFQVERGMNRRAAKQLVRSFFALRQGLRAWQHTQVALMRQRGYVETRTGRRRRMPLITRANDDEAQKAALNMPVQGMASELTLMSFIEVASYRKNLRERRHDWRVAALIHDEILLLVRDEYVHEIGTFVQDVMLRTAEQWLPEVPWRVDIDVGKDWGHMKGLGDDE